MKHSAVTRIACGIFLFFVENAFSFVFDKNPQYPMYYLLAAVFDSIIVFSLPVLGNSKLIRDIQWINAVSIMVQFLGFTLYMSYKTPDIYNFAIEVLTISEWVRLLWISKNDKRHPGDNFWLDSFFHSVFNVQRVNSKG